MNYVRSKDVHKQLARTTLSPAWEKRASLALEEGLSWPKRTEPPKNCETIGDTFGLFDNFFERKTRPTEVPKYFGAGKVFRTLRNGHQLIPWEYCCYFSLSIYSNMTLHCNGAILRMRSIGCLLYISNLQRGTWGFAVLRCR